MPKKNNKKRKDSKDRVLKKYDFGSRSIWDIRVSEFCGLTFGDLDFQNRRIRVDHQPVWTKPANGTSNMRSSGSGRSTTKSILGRCPKRRKLG